MPTRTDSAVSQPSYEEYLRDTLPAFFAAAVDIFGDEDEAAVVAQRAVLQTYYATIHGSAETSEPALAEVA